MVDFKLLSVAATVCLAPSFTFSQPTAPDTLFLKTSIDHVRDVYDQSTKSYSQLYNGKEYVAIKKNMPEVGTMFFLSEEWEEGAVHYDGVLYERVSMRYDQLHDKLVIEHKGYSEIELISEKIKHFDLLHHTFVRIDPNPTMKSIISPGFYDLIYDGQSKVLVKRLKVAEERVETQTSMILTYKEKNSVFIFKGGRYHMVNNKSSVLKIFEDQKSALKKFISKNHIKYKKNKEGALIQIAREYDDLSR